MSRLPRSPNGIDTQPGPTLQILTIVHRHGIDAAAQGSEAGAQRALAAFARQWWHEVAGRDGCPAESPADGGEVARLYFDAHEDEWWVITPAQVDQTGRDPMMRIIIPLVVDYDAEEWAQECGIPVPQASHDFDAVLRRTISDGAIAEALDQAWPMMRGHITAHTVDGLDAATRDELLHLLQPAHDADQAEVLITEVRNHLAAHRRDLDGRPPRWVIFHTMEWDNGSFLTGSAATVYFEDGSNLPFDFHGSAVDDLLTDRYGARGPSAALGVDLHEAKLEFDDYGDNLPHTLGIPTSSQQ